MWNPRWICLSLSALMLVKPAFAQEDYGDEIEKEIQSVERSVGRPGTPSRSRTRSRRRDFYGEESSETSGTPMIRLSPVAGYDYSGWDGASPEGGHMESLGGFTAGVAVLIGRERFYGETGLQYAQRGSVYTGPLKNVYGNYLTGEGASIKTVTEYIEIPAFARFDLLEPTASPVQLFVRGGLVFGILTGSSTDINFGGSSVVFPGASDVNVVNSEQTLGMSLSSTDWRWAAGLGTNVRLAPQLSLTFDALYERSFVDIVESGDQEAYLSGFTIRTGVVFDL